MRLDYTDYIKLVKGTYNKHCADGLLPLLAKSTPANIRKACEHAYKERPNKKDEQMLKAFFGPADSTRQLLDRIKGFQADLFRPLNNYLIGKTEKTDEMNLELLAWLLDFPHRPWSFKMEVMLTEEELAMIGKPISVPAPSDKEEEIEKEAIKEATDPSKIKIIEEPEEEDPLAPLATGLEKTTRKDWAKKAVALFLILMISTAAVYTIWPKKQDKKIALGHTNTGCMYWTGSRYAVIDCNDKRSDRFKLPLDSGKMKNFKRITKEDTITEKSIGVIYCVSIDGKLEFYTSAGNHPVDVTRTLKVLSRHVYNVHLRKPAMNTSNALAEESER